MKILFISPHTDDVELSCSCTILRFRVEHFIRVVALSDCHIPGIRDEFLSAMQELGVQDVNLLHFSHRHFHNSRQKVLDALIEQRKIYQPDMVFLPRSDDIHQDHQVVAAEGLRAFPDISVIQYGKPGNTISNYFVPVDDPERKIKVLSCYQSQQHRPYFDIGYTVAALRYYGSLCGETYAEGFYAYRLKV